jgi:hypothetical protein
LSHIIYFISSIVHQLWLHQCFKKPTYVHIHNLKNKEKREKGSLKKEKERKSGSATVMISMLVPSKKKMISMWVAFGGGSATPVWPEGGFSHLHKPKK